jgi:hypothetical protein
MPGLPVELPPDHHPSLSEDYMNPAQIEYFRRKLRYPEPDDNVHEGDQSDQASADAERSFDAINRARYLDFARILVSQSV